MRAQGFKVERATGASWTHLWSLQNCDGSKKLFGALLWFWTQRRGELSLTLVCATGSWWVARVSVRWLRGCYNVYTEPGTSRGWEGGASGPASDLGHSDLDTEGRMQMEEQRTPLVKYHPSGDPSWWDHFTLLPHPRPNDSKSWQISAIRSNLLRISRYSQPGISTTRPALSSIPRPQQHSIRHGLCFIQRSFLSLFQI